MQKTVLLCTKDRRDLKSAVIHKLQAMVRSLAMTTEQKQKEAEDRQRQDALCADGTEPWEKRTLHAQDQCRAEVKRYACMLKKKPAMPATSAQCLHHFASYTLKRCMWLPLIYRLLAKAEVLAD